MSPVSRCRQYCSCERCCRFISITRVLTIWIGVLCCSYGLLLYFRPDSVLRTTDSSSSYLHYFIPYYPPPSSSAVGGVSRNSALAQIDTLTLIHLFIGLFGGRGTLTTRRRCLQLLTAPYLLLLTYRFASAYYHNVWVVGSSYNPMRWLRSIQTAVLGGGGGGGSSYFTSSFDPLIVSGVGIIIHLIAVIIALVVDTEERLRANSADGTAEMRRDSSSQKAALDAAHRLKVHAEFIATEETYVRNLNSLCDQFVSPLKREPARYDLTDRDVSLMFANIEVIVAYHRILLQQLTNTEPPPLPSHPSGSGGGGGKVSAAVNAANRKSGTGFPSVSSSNSHAHAPTPVNIGAVLSKSADYMRMYTTYLNNYSTGTLTVIAAQRNNSKFQSFLIEQRKLVSIDLMSLLILPVQRVPRYELLLKELIRVTPVAHPERAAHDTALQKIQQIAIHINEAKRSVEQLTVLLRVQNRLAGGGGGRGGNGSDKSSVPSLFAPHRRLVREGAVHRFVDSLFSARNSKPALLFLFNDMILWTNASHQYKYVEDCRRCDRAMLALDV